MALLSWNEIRARAIKFSKEWENETSEHAEAKSFWKYIRNNYAPINYVTLFHFIRFILN